MTIRRWRSLTLRIPPEIVDRLKKVQLPRGLCAAEAFWCWFEALEAGRPICMINWSSQVGAPDSYHPSYMRRRRHGELSRTVEGASKSAE